MGRHAQCAAHREGARRTRRSNPRAQSRELRVRKNVRTDRESIEVPTRHEEVSVERVLLSGEASVELFFVVATSTGLVPGLAPLGHGYNG